MIRIGIEIEEKADGGLTIKTRGRAMRAGASPAEIQFGHELTDWINRQADGGGQMVEAMRPAKVVGEDLSGTQGSRNGSGEG